jgi:hypothetical protein
MPYQVCQWAGPVVRRRVPSRAAALILARATAAERGCVVAVYPWFKGGTLGPRVARVEPDGAEELYGPDHFERGLPATMGITPAIARP